MSFLRWRKLGGRLKSVAPDFAGVFFFADLTF
jgi:hypothetical protein